jgi:hypothetical protein
MLDCLSSALHAAHAAGEPAQIGDSSASASTSPPSISPARRTRQLRRPDGGRPGLTSGTSDQAHERLVELVFHAVRTSTTVGAR